MAIETIMLTVGRSNESRVDKLTQSAVELAETTGARVVIGHAFETQDDADAVRDRLDMTEGDATDVANRMETVRRASKALRAAGVDFEVQAVVGDPGEVIADLAEEVGADRILVGGRKRSPAGKAVFGSTAQRILLSAPCPVTFVRE
ncbi:universal stress protein [Candidatus Halobonum tyrrellensis]|uniref:UspA domain-containing protein n=1 Tax=Candidatus Halobonum tyrrellensis G22 TaxID=1324957 RepID=V4HCD7_9EURY|nr:universal stress protein [Candidatus Halobonum tyrrellensis]ESP87723.1 UspA domain-containing protein [Candidatus Halobonum tyrrellensis G22]